ncbi:hypothetical protein RHGRI_022190 [Rhododendron griersonianum]|uniref:PAZ domain-containing protein n=1 Tax=Rhododendron griersonianum TaxID=479676 RepID=A0AAV6JPN8_9ERIC|nr:hypothetical protein RHGRI_022190 [Rhododendron griersonianum]
MAPSSLKSDRPPARPGWGRAGRKCVIGANHFIGDVIVKDVHHYDVTITPEIPSKKVCRDTISELVTSYRESHLGKCSPAYYDGRKSLYTAGSLPFSSNDFVVKLVDKLDSKDRKELKYDVAIKFAGKADLHHYLQQFLGGMQLDAPQETLQVLDVILRSEPSTNYVVVGRSFFSPSLGETGILDMSARAFCEPVLVSKFVEGCNIDQDRIKVENALKNVRVELVFRDGRQCKISGVSAKPLSPLMNGFGSEVLLIVLPGTRFLEANVELYTWLSVMVVDSYGFRDICQVRCWGLPIGFGGIKVDLMEFSRDDLGKKTSVVQYYHKRYQINLSFLSLPALQVGWDAMPVCLPMELCKIVQGQSYSKKLNEKQVTALLRTTCQRPHDREQSINKLLAPVVLSFMPDDVVQYVRGKEHLLVQERVMDDRFLKDGHLFSSFGFTSKQNAWAGPDDWKYKKAKGLEDVSSPTIVEPRNKMSDVFAPPTNRAPCNATVPEDCNYQPEDHYDVRRLAVPWHIRLVSLDILSLNYVFLLVAVP